VRTLRLALVALLPLLPVAGALAPAHAANFFAPDARFAVKWEPGQSKRGAPLVWGYVTNNTSTAATDVRLRVEVLDASGQVVGEIVTRLPGEVHAGGRSYFEVPVRAPGASYRISVVSFSYIRS
jgi:hypothetical protein